ncbi:MAG: imidazole glycerol phosphate synthase subunit HisH [Leptospiraceae bacterium]|jgi:glutamine amidotransferase|nr:imidazole glycerol phosphate synthase subunit HisH [Leptospiraceae bacterium]
MSSKLKICIVDYGVGNVYSVSNALSYLGYTRLKISDKENEIKNSDVILLPGVGAFDAAMRNLKLRNLDQILASEVIIKKKTILGICVGMQMLATTSEENGIHEGLNWIEGTVRKLKLPEKFPVPHVGWNNVIFQNQKPLFEKNQKSSHFYFDHSYFFDCDPIYISSWCDYGINVTASIQKDNIFGVQFHPEKSQTNGLKLFRSFFNSI